MSSLKCLMKYTIMEKGKNPPESTFFHLLLAKSSKVEGTWVYRVVGKVAAENSHKWVFKETTNDTDPTFISPWNMSIEPVRISVMHLFEVHLTGFLA